MTTTRWVLLVCVLCAAALLALPLDPVAAGDDDNGYSGNGHFRRHYDRVHYPRPVVSRSCTTDFWGRCMHVAPHRHAYRWRYQGFRRAYWRDNRWRDRRWRDNDHFHGRIPGAGERIDHGLLCHARRRVVGEERPSKAKAQRAADNAWMGAVRYDHGERYQDLNNARDVRHNCDPSSTTTILKRVFFRCVIEATPCRGPLGASTERVERRYEEETDEDDK